MSEIVFNNNTENQHNIQTIDHHESVTISRQIRKVINHAAGENVIPKDSIGDELFLQQNAQSTLASLILKTENKNALVIQKETLQFFCDGNIKILTTVTNHNDASPSVFENSLKTGSMPQSDYQMIMSALFGFESIGISMPNPSQVSQVEFLKQKMRID